MLGFPLGILSAAGAGGVAAGDYELISSEILGSSQASVTFSNLGDYSSTYKHLQIRATMRSASTTQDYFLLRHNGNNVNARHILYGDTTGVYSIGASGSTDLGAIPKSNDGASEFAGAVIDLLDAYSTSKNKTIRCFNGINSTVKIIQIASALRIDTASTTSLQLANFYGTSFAAGSRFSLYGLK
jgi:hypothetical protein